MVRIKKLNDSINEVERGLKKITDERLKEERKLDMLDGDELKAAKAKLKAEDKFIDQEKKLKLRQKALLEEIQEVVQIQQSNLEEDREYQLTVRKNIASRAGEVGDMAGKGYVDMERKGDRYLFNENLPRTSDARFETINTLPRIASKYQNSERGPRIDRMSERDPNFLISPSFGTMLSNEQKGYKP